MDFQRNPGDDRSGILVPLIEQAIIHLQVVAISLGVDKLNDGSYPASSKVISEPYCNTIDLGELIKKWLPPVLIYLLDVGRSRMSETHDCSL
ncbi:hypothetical protein [Streptomyces aureus]|uniref:hypothetical protein n=1 Tax=Streptomyces aureus TaxID=193461 RepID=UPI0033CEC93F